MFAAERQRRITEIIQEYKHIDVKSLSSMLSVTKATIRRDLEILEKEGILVKVHGGAVLNEEHYKSKDDMLHTYEFGENDPLIKEKRQIARIAVKLIGDGDIIYLGHGKTCACIAEEIKENVSSRNLTIITNNLLAVNILYNIAALNVICLGGQTNPEGHSAALFGPVTISLMNEMNISKSFFTVDGISIQNGYMLANPQFKEILNIAVKKSQTTFMAADYQKFNRNSLVTLSDIHGIENVITNENIPNEYKTFYYENNIKLFTTIEDPRLIL